MKRPYTGLTEGVGTRRKRAGTEHFVSCVEYLSGGRLWNNGTFGIRPIRGGSKLSVHATGRAMDISWRKTERHPGASRSYAVEWIDFLVKNADELGVEMIVDYSYAGGLGGGRSWRCDRSSWTNLKKGAVAGGGASWADWIHVEICPFAADSVPWVDGVFKKALGAIPQPPK